MTGNLADGHVHLPTDSPATLVVITSSYPYDIGKEDTFLGPEVPHLLNEFDRVILVPERTEGIRAELPPNAEVDESYAMRGHRIWRYVSVAVSALRLRLFWKELFCRPQTLLQPTALSSLVYMAGKVQRTKKWMRAFILRERIDTKHAVFYTYWLEQATLGIGMLKHEYLELNLVSRAHGFDLYEYRHKPPYIPLQAERLKRLNRLHLISEDGKQYICTRYPWFSDYCHVSRMGVLDPGFLAKPSNDGMHRIVSCSFLTPVKRIDLLFQSLVYLAETHPDHQIEWRHIGDGPLMQELHLLVARAPVNLTVHLLGYLPNKTVMQLYHDTPCDLFVNVSSSEGISVAIMEAQSCGIPVVATRVGGTPEIVFAQNGALLPPNPTPNQIAETMWALLSEPNQLLQKRALSHANWQERYNADLNFAAFAQLLRSMIS